MTPRIVPANPDMTVDPADVWNVSPMIALIRKLRSKRQRCPFCSERIRVEATTCPHCGRDAMPRG